MTRPLYARVALPLPLPDLFDYSVPPALQDQVRPGCRVEVPFGRRRSAEVGFCVEMATETSVPPAKIKSIAALMDPVPIVAPSILALTRWMASYYACSWGEALQASVPGGVKKGLQSRTVKVLRLAVPSLDAEERIRAVCDRYPGQGRILRLLLEADGQLTRQEVSRRCQVSVSPIDTLVKSGFVKYDHVRMSADPLAGLDVPPAPTPHELAVDQARVLGQLEGLLDAQAFGVMLLHGVTGSGKTEVYLRAIRKVLEDGGGAIVLIPEIALTPQTVSRFRARFKEVAILHSGLTGAQRHDQWIALREGRARVAIGPRSAVFAPVADLRLIVVDEEHEPSYKQQSTPRYHARDVAVVRARTEGAVVLLGTATPAMETYNNATNGKYVLAEMPERIASSSLPAVKIVDMAQESTDRGVIPMFSRPLIVGITEALGRDEQVILFLNRRGFSTYLHCPRCKHVHTCERCDVSMTYHRRLDRTICHYCLSETRPPRRCPACDNPKFRFTGAGTQKLEAELARLFPGRVYARMDSDTMTTAEHYDTVLRRFGSGEVQILFGTQMIAKGLDFPRVSVVGVLSADIGMQFPDFRASERTFQLVAQVSGRAGRGEIPGRVYVQTRFPDHYAITCASRHDYAAFYAREIEARRQLGYPPFGRLVRVLLEDEREDRVIRTAAQVREQLMALLGPGLTLLGPAPAPITQLRERYRYQLLVKAASAGALAPLREPLARLAGRSAASSVTVDVDPTSML